MSSFESQLLAPELHLPSHPSKKVDVTALYLMAEEAFDNVYAPEDRTCISSQVTTLDRLISPHFYQTSTEIWPEVEMLFSGWGMVPMNEEFFRRFPKLKVVFYAAGTVRAFVTDTFWEHGVRLTNAAAAGTRGVRGSHAVNCRPVYL